MRVEKPDELKPAFQKAFDARGTFVIDVHTDREARTPITPWTEARAQASLGYADE